MFRMFRSDVSIVNDDLWMLDAHVHVMQGKLCKANTRGVTLDILSVNWLEHLSGPISIPPEFICWVCPLLAELASSKIKVHRHYDPIYSPSVNQHQELPHLLHSTSTTSLRPPGIAHGNLINVSHHKMFPLWHVEPSLCPILHVCVQRGSDVLSNHPILQLQVRATHNPRSRSPMRFQTKKWWKRSKCGRMPR